MDTTSKLPRRTFGERAQAVIVISFATATAMWCAGYICRLPALALPAPRGFALLILCLGGGGFAAGSARVDGRRGAWPSGLLTGLGTSLINLLVIGSLIARPESRDMLPHAAAWVAGYLCAGMAVAALGGALAGLGAPPAASGEPANWSCRFAIVGFWATLLLIVLGGVVTSKDAGMAVPDWPTSFGANMFLYPLSRMTGDIYFEHSHRLCGALVGVISLSLCVFLARARERHAVLGLALLLFALVVLQGALGGIRVLQDDPRIAVVHGIGAQIILGLFALLGALVSSRWRTGSARIAPGGRGDRSLWRWLLAAVLLQLALGALLRHRGQGMWLFPHIGGAIVVLALAAVSGARAALAHRQEAILRRLGLVLIYSVGAQFLLGISAYGATRFDPSGSSEVLLATTHQVVGALVLATAVLLASWGHRLLAPEGAGTPAILPPGAHK
ncbi:MAG: COX15/CtaA family protein [Planctomycetes bacterium]|nr:COX15/CtaA family protein [Planctomycetota bacterium]